MNDQINRQKLMKKIIELQEGYALGCYTEECEKAHKNNFSCADCMLDRLAWWAGNQPPADQWIPCSDPRKPINGQEIVVTVDLFGKWTHIATTTYYTEKPKHWWEDEWDGEGFYQSHECGYCRREDVTAWFALEPYKGVE